MSEGKEKKGKKEYSDFTEHRYFNINAVPSRHTAVLLSDMLDRVEVILNQHDLVMKPWCTLDTLSPHVIDAWTGNDSINQKNWWMDRYIDEVGYMIWNDINRKYYNEWYKTGVLIHVPELFKKERNGDGVAGYFADNAVKEFVEPYK